jgi:FADH2 O2-dependent halogenase
VLGPRVLQLPHAASFVDPLFSSGMSVLTVAMDLIAEQLLAAVKENNFAQERFQVMEDVVNQGFDHYDMIVSHSFDAFENYELWNAWNRMWMMGNYMGTWGPLSLLLKYLSSDDRSYLALTTARERVGVLSSHLPEIRDMMVISAKDVEEAVGGRMPHSEAAKRIFARMEAMDFLPPYMGFGKAEQRAPAVFSQPAGFRHVLWYRYSAPPKWKEYADFPIMAYTEHVFRFFFDQGKTAARRFLHAFRDVFIDYNNDWRYTPMGQRAEGYVVLPPPMPEDVPELGEVKSLPSQKGSMAASMTEGDAQRIAEPSSRAG